MKILFAGTPSIAVTVLGALVNAGHEVVGVLTREDSAVGRKRLIAQSAVAEFAATKGIPVIKANQVTDQELTQIGSMKADLAIVVAYGAILKKEVLEALPLGWFNLHFSLLPKYRGAAPVQHALLNGEAETGVTLFKLDKGMDTGLILAQVPTKIELDENAGRLLQRLAHLGVTVLSEELPKIFAGTASLSSQTGQVSYAPKLNRVDAQLDFGKSANTVMNLIRAMNPEPMAWALVNDQPLRVLDARFSAHTGEAKPGFIEKSLGNPVVCCGDGGWIELIEVQPAGKKPMAGSDWIRGHADFEAFDS